MLFFGWGRSSKQWPMGGELLVCSYRYVHLWWFFKLALGQDWLLLHDQRSADRKLSRDEVERMYGPDAPQLSLWDRYGLLALVAVVGLVVVATSITGSSGR